MESELTINSKEYWDKRFATGDWEAQGGNNQTRYFYKLLYHLLPENLKNKFYNQNKQYTICDVGCAEGDGTNLLAKKFPNTEIIGIDISESAIKKANEKYPAISFQTQLDKRYDVIMSSNVLEHFEDPFVHLNKLFEHSNQYVILLVPFEEFDRINEHFYTFLYKDFPLKYRDFNLIYIESTLADKAVWNGKQHLFIFQKNADMSQLSLKDFGIETIIEKRTQELLLTNEELHEANKKIIEFNSLIIDKDNIIQEKSIELNNILNSRAWKAISMYYHMRDNTIGIKHLYSLSKSLKHTGVKRTFLKLINKVNHTFKNIAHRKIHKKTLSTILNKYPAKPIMILPPLIDWNIPLFQRPQHLGRNIAKQDMLYFFCTPNGLYDNVDGFEEVSQRCYITNRFDLVDQIADRKKVYDLSSTDNGTDWSFVSTRLDRGDEIVYQYIDEISKEISGHEIPKSLFEKHFNILKDERCIVIPSATKLEDDVKEHRTKNYKLVTNGVEIAHFSQSILQEQYPELIKKLLSKNKPIIGYFGAFANWFDYELVIKLATERHGLEILLLGVDYDGSIKKYHLEEYDNITIAGPIDYKELPKYAAAFNVSIIPFLINDITESTSPIKLFEYMAMKKPIITTNMPECKKYESVLIGKDHNTFIVKIDIALELSKDESYLQLLEKEASENSWETKAKDIVKMIEKNEEVNL